MIRNHNIIFKQSAGFSTQLYEKTIVKEMDVI